VGKVLLLGFLFALSSCRHGRCFRDSDCGKSLVCLDPEVKEVAAARRCEPAQVRCVAGCVARCSADSCDEGQVCGGSGCCEPRPCKLNGDCQGDLACVDGKCTAVGRCMEPPEG